VLKLGLFAARHTIYIGADSSVLHVDRDVRAATAGPDLVTRLEQLGVARDARG